MHPYQKKFLEIALANPNKNHNALQFGDFTLKSGRSSPYFFLAGVFNNGKMLAEIGKIFAQTIIQQDITFNGLFGPAYKGIPFVSATAIALSEDFQLNKPWTFNRKELKNHGEGGQFIGADISGKQIIIDDVLTAGTAVKESINLIQQNGGEVVAVFTLLDRCETIANDSISAKSLILEKYNIPVYSVVTIYDVITYLENNHQVKEALAIQKHLEVFGA